MNFSTCFAFPQLVAARGGDDIFTSGYGRDTIKGGDGNDVLVGGSSTDRFVFTRADLSGTAAAGTVLDRVEDFAGVGVAGGDIVVLSGLRS